MNKGDILNMVLALVLAIVITWGKAMDAEFWIIYLGGVIYYKLLDIHRDLKNK